MRIKNEYQNFFKRECFTHHITLPPSTLNEKSVLSAMRKIEFKLNKTFLKSSFPSYKETDRFRFFSSLKTKKYAYSISMFCFILLVVETKSSTLTSALRVSSETNLTGKLVSIALQENSTNCLRQSAPKSKMPR